MVVEMENGTAEIAIYDLVGNEVLQMASANGATRIDISALAKGTYFVWVNVGGKSSVRKFVH